jgi:hypothetical protein
MTVNPRLLSLLPSPGYPLGAGIVEVKVSERGLRVPLTLTLSRNGERE